MKFTSIHEYFYKLQNILCMTIIIPLLLFAYLYLQGNVSPLLLSGNGGAIAVTVIIAVIALLTVIITYRMFVKRLRAIRSLQGLGIKMERYATATIAHFVTMSFVFLLLAAGLYFTGDQLFSILFVVGLTAVAVQWPMSRRICRDLKLKGAERDIMLRKENWK